MGNQLKAIVSEVKNQDVGSLTGVPSWIWFCFKEF
jgi:hypothetical protein